jgi:hypothetical protein
LAPGPDIVLQAFEVKVKPRRDGLALPLAATSQQRPVGLGLRSALLRRGFRRLDDRRHIDDLDPTLT